MSLGSFVVDVAAAAVKKIRNRPKAVARREARAARKNARRGEQPPDEVAEDFNSTDEVSTMNAGSLKGAAKSKLMWLGFVQVAYGLFELWANGALTADSAGPVITGALTMVLRAITTESLADKVAK